MHERAERDFYPRPPRGGRLSEEERKQADEKISIHALREEGDPELLEELRKAKISIHALREEGDAANTPLSTVARNFYPRPPRGGRHKALERELMWTKISIHALREEGDEQALVQLA